MFTALVPNVHSELAGHVPVWFALRNYRRKRIPNLLADGVGIRKLHTVSIRRKDAVMKVEIKMRHVGAPSLQAGAC
jgi:hypothetical protein